MAYEAEIIAAAARYGVDSHVALAVAQQESGRQQYWQSGPKKGQLKIGSAGEIGIFQVEPASAPGVDLRDPHQNIQAGVGLLAKLYAQFRTWPLALAAYNWGAKGVNEVLAGKRQLPTQVRQYVQAVMGAIQGSQAPGGGLAPWQASGALQAPVKPGKLSPAVVAVGILAVGVVIVLALR